MTEWDLDFNGNEAEVWLSLRQVLHGMMLGEILSHDLSPPSQQSFELKNYAIPYRRAYNAYLIFGLTNARHEIDTRP